MTIIHKERSEVVRRVSMDEFTPSTASASSPSPDSSLKLKKEQQTFPFKLFEMIKYANDSGDSSLLSWSPDGKIFYIHNKDAMMNDLAPRFFNQTKFRSFVSVLICMHRSPFAVTFIVFMCMWICCCVGMDSKICSNYYLHLSMLLTCHNFTLSSRHDECTEKKRRLSKKAKRRLSKNKETSLRDTHTIRLFSNTLVFSDRLRSSRVS